jgi:hypothetical protein
VHVCRNRDRETTFLRLVHTIVNVNIDFFDIF